MTRTLLTSLFCFISLIHYGQKNFHYADSIRKAFNIPELSYAVVTNNHIEELVAIGQHSAALLDTATLNDRFHLGSNTKAMTAFIIAKYVEKGALKWSTKFFDIFPIWKQHSKSQYYNISLKDLLSHRAHIQAFQGENDPLIPNFQGSKQHKRELFGKFVLTLDPVPIDSLHPFSYSNAGYTLATLMLEKVTKRSWEQLVEKVFNKDLKLNVEFSWPENQTKNDTWGHIVENGIQIPVASDTNYHWIIQNLQVT